MKNLLWKKSIWISSTNQRLSLITLFFLLVTAFIAACSVDEQAEDTAPKADTTSVSFDGAHYSSEAEKIGHGARLAKLLACDGCHAKDYSGVNFGEFIPLVEGLWATNISLTMPNLSDNELERLLREGVHPNREIFLMPSKQSQFLSDLDMKALISFLRTIEPTGDATPLPPEGFREAVTAKLPEDYWRTSEQGQKKIYHSAAQEAAYFKKNAVPDFGEEFARGRMLVMTMCSSCHGAAMDGVGEPAGNIQNALKYSDEQFERLLRQSVDLNGKQLEMSWGGSIHIGPEVTDAEMNAAIQYIRRLARKRAK